MVAVPIPILEAMLLAVAEQTGRDAERLQSESVRVSADKTLRTVWRVLLRFTSDDAIVSRTPAGSRPCCTPRAVATSPPAWNVRRKARAGA
jgi:hypothetical protein